jgi:uncharacterized membrane protein YGL010W
MSPRAGEPLIAWQQRLYDRSHRSRKNLMIHVVAVPAFMLGSLTLVAGWAAAWWLPLVGLATMALAMAVQKVGHGLEAEPFVPFDGPGDALARIFVEQWITFPRYLASGGFARAWRQP